MHKSKSKSKPKETKPKENETPTTATDEYINEICQIAKRVIKIDKDLPEIITKWELNRTLVFLHKKCIPEQIIIDMFNQIEEKVSASLSGSKLHSVMDKDQILQSTTYEKEKSNSFNDSTIFKSAMPKSDPSVKSDVVITSTPEKSSGFDDSFWNDLLK